MKKISKCRNQFWLVRLFGFFLVFLSVSLCQAGETKGLSLEFISEQRSISPSSTFTVGLQIKHEKGYHTYWKNPGIVGMATSLKWKLPKGFTADPIQWAYPEISSMAGHPCHGYERDVVLLVEITAPEKIASEEVTLSAKATWMCCADDCYPGEKEFSLVIPVSERSELNEKHTAIFEKARAELPLQDSPWKVVLLSKKDEPKLRFKLTLKSGSKDKVPEYIFSDDGQLSSDLKQVFTQQTDGSYLLTIARSEYSPKSKKEFDGVLKVGYHSYSFTSSYKH